MILIDTVKPAFSDYFWEIIYCGWLNFWGTIFRGIPGGSDPRIPVPTK